MINFYWQWMFLFIYISHSTKSTPPTFPAPNAAQVFAIVKLVVTGKISVGANRLLFGGGAALVEVLAEKREYLLYG